MANSHWSEAYLPLPYETGRFNCADLVRRVQLEQCGREIQLPSEHTPSSLEDFVADFASPVVTPREFDGILMKIRGSRMDDNWHVGVAAIVSGQPWVLHALEFHGVIFCPVSKLRLLMLELVNYYRWLE